MVCWPRRTHWFTVSSENVENRLTIPSSSGQAGCNESTQFSEATSLPHHYHSGGPPYLSWTRVVNHETRLCCRFFTSFCFRKSLHLPVEYVLSGCDTFQRNRRV